MKKYRKSKSYYYFRRQKLYGVAMVILGVLSAFIADGDITAALLVVPLGLCLIFTRKKVMYDEICIDRTSKKFAEWMES